MKIYDEIDLQPSRRELLKFGAIVMGGFAVLGAAFHFAFDNFGVARVLWIIGPTVFALSLLRPVGRVLYILWMGLGVTIGLVTSPVMLVITYILLVVPVGFVFKLAGRDSMRRRPDPNASSYWEDYPSTPDPKRYVRQF
jgi:hypothetical protein